VLAVAQSAEVAPVLRSIRAGALAAAVLLLLPACGATNADFPPPPRTAEITSAVTVSPDGKVITARGVIACGHRPVLVARSYPGRVTLEWVNPDTSCNAEAIMAVFVIVRLSVPLGHRRLVQASTGTPIPYHISQDSP
jgi:hypothetical protein